MSSGVPIFEKATGRVVAVIVLLMAIAAALRGYLPGVDRSEPEPPRTGSSLIYVAVLLSVSLVIVSVALVVRLREPRRAPASASPMPTRSTSGRSRPAWRVMLIGAGVLLLWLVLLWLMARYVGPQDVDQPTSQPPATVAPPAGDAASAPDARDDGLDRGMVRNLLAGVAVLLVLIAAGAVAGRRRRPPAQQTLAAPVSGEPRPVAAAAHSLVRAAESGLAEVEDPTHEPRQAIIACYAAMERELGRFPGAAPREFDTPTEVLARAVEHRALDIDNATELVSLFEEARFSPHVMTETHRGRAIDVLQLVLADMRSLV